MVFLKRALIGPLCGMPDKTHVFEQHIYPTYRHSHIRSDLAINGIDRDHYTHVSKSRHILGEKVKSDDSLFPIR